MEDWDSPNKEIGEGQTYICCWSVRYTFLQVQKVHTIESP